MVSRKALLIAVAALMAVVVGALLPATTSAFPNNHIVGELEQRWDVDVNYDDWAISDTFYAGDTIQFIYPPANHNVVMVDEDGYNACDATNNLGTWNTGNDYVQLPGEPGKYFYICSMGDHCSRGMKLAITAESAE